MNLARTQTLMVFVAFGVSCLKTSDRGTQSPEATEWEAYEREVERSLDEDKQARRKLERLEEIGQALLDDMSEGKPEADARVAFLEAAAEAAVAEERARDWLSRHRGDIGASVAIGRVKRLEEGPSEVQLLASLPAPEPVPRSYVGTWSGEIAERRKGKDGCIAAETRRLTLTIGSTGSVTWKGYTRLEEACPRADVGPPVSCWAEGLGTLSDVLPDRVTLSTAEQRKYPGPLPRSAFRILECGGRRVMVHEDQRRSMTAGKGGGRCVDLGPAAPPVVDQRAAALQCRLSAYWADLGEAKLGAPDGETIRLDAKGPASGSLRMVMRRVPTMAAG